MKMVNPTIKYWLSDVYTYTAFRTERDSNNKQENPFRYCGEYYDFETSSVYLRARYYVPGLGRFTQADTHWNPGNMQFGDNPVEQVEGKYMPSATAIMQSGNLYVYAINNPLVYRDSDGESISIAAIILIASIVAGVASAGYTAYNEVKYQEQTGHNTADIIFNTVGNGILGFGTIYTLGTAGYGLYLNMANYYGFVPITQIGGNPAAQGTWQNVNESMSATSRNYQTQITGRTNQAYVLNGVKFDGVSSGSLIEAKGNYSNFVNAQGSFYSWFNGQNQLVSQAYRQLAASEGSTINWYFSNQASLDATKQLFKQYGIDGINLIYQAIK